MRSAAATREAIRCESSRHAPFPFESVKSAMVRVQRIELRDAAADQFLTLVDFSAEGGRLLNLVEAAR